MVFSYKIKRFYIRWRYFQVFWEKRFSPKKENLSPYQQKAIKLWRMMVRNSNASLQYNSSGVRQIEHNDLMLVFNENEFILTILDLNTQRKCVYEIHVPQQWGEENVIVYFDFELSKRMRETENSKRSIIGDSLDTLLRQEERSLNRFKAGLEEN